MLYEQYCLFKLCKDLHNREINKPPQQRGHHLLRPPCFWTIVHCTCAVPTCKIVSRSSSQTALLSNREHGLFLLGVKHELQQQNLALVIILRDQRAIQPLLRGEFWYSSISLKKTEVDGALI